METNGTTVGKYCNLELLLQHKEILKKYTIGVKHNYQNFTDLEM